MLSEFRGRVAAHGLEEAVLDALLAKLAADGLVRAGGKQRTDSTHVIAAVRALHTTELAGESVRAALEALAAACPDWLAARFCLGDWEPPLRRPDQPGSGRPRARRSGTGSPCSTPETGTRWSRRAMRRPRRRWLREIPAVQVLRTVLIQSFTRAVDEGGREVISRREPGRRRVPARPSQDLLAL